MKNNIAIFFISFILLAIVTGCVEKNDESKVDEENIELKISENSEIKVGIKEKEVETILGEPQNVNVISVNNSQTDVWTYDNHSVVYFSEGKLIRFVDGETKNTITDNSSPEIGRSEDKIKNEYGEPSNISNTSMGDISIAHWGYENGKILIFENNKVIYAA